MTVSSWLNFVRHAPAGRGSAAGLRLTTAQPSRSVCVSPSAFFISCCLSLAECPNITMEALGGKRCSNNSETVLMQPGPLGFTCLYELPSLTTMTQYTWLLDGVQTGDSASAVNITIPSGSHNVTSTASINVTTYLLSRGQPVAQNCDCYDTRTIPVTVVGRCLIYRLYSTYHADNRIFFSLSLSLSLSLYVRKYIVLQFASVSDTVTARDPAPYWQLLLHGCLAAANQNSLWNNH